MPRTDLHRLPHSFGKGSVAVLIGHVTEHEGASGEHEGSGRGARESVRRARGSCRGAASEHAKGHTKYTPVLDDSATAATCWHFGSLIKSVIYRFLFSFGGPKEAHLVLLIDNLTHL